MLGSASEHGLVPAVDSHQLRAPLPESGDNVDGAERGDDGWVNGRSHVVEAEENTFDVQRGVRCCACCEEDKKEAKEEAKREKERKKDRNKETKKER